MPSYKKLYYRAFNAITDAQRLIEKASAILVEAQQECEEIYISDKSKDNLILIQSDADENES